MKDGIRVFLSDELEKIVKQEANAEHISPGDYISMIVKEALEDKSLDDDYEELDEVKAQDRSKEVQVHLYGEDADQLRLKANSMGLTPTSYIRRLIYTKEYFNINVPTDDLRELIDTFIKFEQSYTAVVGYIKRGDGEVFKQDIELLKDSMSEISDLFKKQVEISYKSRLKVENKMMKHIRDEIKKVKG